MHDLRPRAGLWMTGTTSVATAADQMAAAHVDSCLVVSAAGVLEVHRFVHTFSAKLHVAPAADPADLCAALELSTDTTLLTELSAAPCKSSQQALHSYW